MNTSTSCRSRKYKYICMTFRERTNFHYTLSGLQVSIFPHQSSTEADVFFCTPVQGGRVNSASYVSFRPGEVSNMQNCKKYGSSDMPSEKVRRSYPTPQTPPPPATALSLSLLSVWWLLLAPSRFYVVQTAG